MPRGLVRANARRIGWSALVLVVAAFSPPQATAELVVVATSPGLNANNVGLLDPITVTFNRPVDRTTFTSQRFWAFGRFSGAVSGPISFANADQTVVLTPVRRFQAGELVTVFLSHDLRAADGTFLRAAGYSWQFQTRARCAGLDMIEIDSMSNRDANNNQTRIYGAVTTDFNGDGWVDIATINEVSADMRMFLNRADGTGLFDDYLEPPLPLLFEISPNEAGDFDRDGNADFAVSSTATNMVCVALGNGDGTFAPAQFEDTGAQPHGVAVLDVDGDGDADIVTANSGGNDLSLFLNNGAGIFGPATQFDGGGHGEYGLIAAEMNGDGILDLVVGCRAGGTAAVLRGNGDGTFTPISSQNIGGSVWVVNAGDLDGDGDMDVASANDGSENGAILLNSGGTLLPPTIYAAPGHTASSDLGDIDGDGDLDWVLSGFGGGAWRIYVNDGSGNFTFFDDVPAPSNPSCAALFDLDNDGDLDVSLFDEIADVVVLVRNTAQPYGGDLDVDGDVDLADLSALLSNFGLSSGAEHADGDIDGDGAVSLADLSALLEDYGSSC